MADSKENYYRDLGSKRFNQSIHFAIFVFCKLYLQIFQTSLNSNNLHFTLSCIFGLGFESLTVVSGTVAALVASLLAGVVFGTY